MVERLGPDAEILAWQSANLTELGVTAQQATDALQWVEVDGTVRSGHEAVAAMLTTAGQPWRIIGRTIGLPGISRAAAKAYQLVADNRHRLPGGTPAGESPDELGA